MTFKNILSKRITILIDCMEEILFIAKQIQTIDEVKTFSNIIIFNFMYIFHKLL
jgi:hypothetical protein